MVEVAWPKRFFAIGKAMYVNTQPALDASLVHCANQANRPIRATASSG